MLDSAMVAAMALGPLAGAAQAQDRWDCAPKATNATVEGRRLNRRVEVTLVGQRASSFN